MRWLYQADDEPDGASRGEIGLPRASPDQGGEKHFRQSQPRGHRRILGVEGDRLLLVEHRNGKLTATACGLTTYELFQRVHRAEVGAVQMAGTSVAA